MSRSGRSSSSFSAGMTIATLYLMASSTSAWGQITTNWTNAAGGTFNVAGNWSAGVPGTLDTANFNASGTYTVTLSNSPSISDLSLFGASTHVTLVSSGGTQTLTLTNAPFFSGGTFTLGSPGVNLVTGGSIAIGLGISSNGVVNIQSGSSITTARVEIGEGGTGTLNVTGAGSTLTSTLSANMSISASFGASGTLNMSSGAVANLSSGTLLVGSNSSATGTLNVQSGSVLTAGNTQIGANGASSSAVGIVTVTGANSSMNQTGTSQLTLGSTAGSTNTGTLNVTNGGIYQTGTGTVTVNSTGTLNVTDGEFVLRGNLTNNGTINVNANGLFRATNSVALMVDAGFNQAANSTLRMEGGADATFNNHTLAASANIEVRDAGSTAAFNGTSLTLGANSKLAIANSGAATVANAFILGSGSQVQLDNGTLNLSSVSSSGGSFRFNTGTINFSGSNTMDANQLNLLLGTGGTLSSGRHLAVVGTATLASPLTLNGGTFSAGSLTGGNLLTLSSGTLNITNSGITVGSGGALGSVVNVASGVTINQTASTANTINSDGRLVLSGGTFNTTGNLTNNGEVQLSSSLTTLGGSGTFINNSTVLGTGRIEKNLTNNAAGSIQVTGNDRLVFNGTTNSNAGRIDATNGGQIEFRNALTNVASTGLITGRDATLRFNAGLTNNGSMAFSNGTMDVFGDIQQNVGGRITISGGGVLNFYDDVTIAPGANSVQASASGGIVSSAVFFGSYNGGITGGGTAFIEGDHRPGNSPGLVSFGGDVFYGGLSTLHAELGGLSRGSQYDAIDVNGVVSLAGNLEIDLINGFVPTPGNTFLLIDNAGTDAVVGTFVGLAEGATFQADGAFFQISYTGGTGNDVVLTSAVPEPGTIALFGLIAGGGVGWWRWRRQQKLLAQEQVSAID